MSDRATLLRAIIDNPDDDAPRLAYADWLDAHIDEFPEADREAARARAAYIRATVAIARIPLPTRPVDPSIAGGGFFHGGITTWTDLRESAHFAPSPQMAERRRLWDNAYPLEQKYGEQWHAELPPTHTQHRPDFCRGFVEHLQISPRLLAQDPALYFDSAPIRSLTLEWNSRYRLNEAEDAPVIAALPQLARIRDLNFFVAGPEFVAAFVRAFIVSPQTAALRTLNLSNPGDPTDVTDAALHALVSSDYLTELHSLDLSRNLLSPEILEELGSTTKLPGLKRLILSQCGLNAEGIARLFRGRLLERLDGMDLEHNPGFDAEATHALVSQPGFVRFRMLGLARNSIGSEGCRVIANSPYTSGLEAIRLSKSGIGGEGIAELLVSPRLASLNTLLLDHDTLDAAAIERFASVAPSIPLRRVNLSYCPIGDDGVRLLAASPLARQLTHLHLRECTIGDAGADAVARSHHFTNLRQLDLSGNTITDCGAELLARSPHLANLERLRMGYNSLTDRGAIALAALPGLITWGLSIHGKNVSKRAEKKIEKLLEGRKRG